MIPRKLLSIRWLLLALLAAMFFGAVACGDGEEGVAETAPTIKIGALLSLSGPGGGTPTTLSHQQAMIAAVEDINSKGGVKVGGVRYRLEIVTVDSKVDAVQTIAGAQQLIQQKVIAVYNGETSFGDQAYQQFKDANVISYATSPGTTYHLDANIPGQGPDKHPFLFSNIDLFQPIVDAHTKMAVNNFPAIKKIGILATNLPIGTQLAAAVERTAKKLGLEYAGAEFVPHGTTDSSPHIVNMRAKKADMVYIVTIVPTIVESAKAAAEQNMAPYVAAWTLRPRDIETIGNLGSTVMISPDWRLPFHQGLVPPEYKDAVAKLGQLSGNEPLHTGWAISQWDFVHMLALAIEKAGTVTDSTAIARALIGIEYDGPFGKTVILSDHSARGTSGMLVKQGNEYTVYAYENIDLASLDEPISTVSAAVEKLR